MYLKLCVAIFFLFYIRQEVTAGSCHYFSHNKLDWFDALFECQRHKLCLADLDTKSVFDQFAAKLPGNLRDEYWFGLNNYEKNSFKYVSRNEFVRYIPPESDLSVENSCAYIKPIGYRWYTFRMSNCGHRRKFICSSAAKCNGQDTLSSYRSSFSAELPCDISDKVKDIIGIPK